MAALRERLASQAVTLTKADVARCRGAGPKPRPAFVRYNDWRAVAAPSPDAFTPALAVSVIIPCYQTPDATLAMTLASLEGQAWPPHLFEVVLVDDGSEPPLRPPASTLSNLRVVRQERRGFGLARARNTGARAAAHDILLFLDSDMLVEADWIAAHARWHHAVSDALTVGTRRHVAMDGIDASVVRRRSGTLKELFRDRPTDASWVEANLARTRDLTSRADDPFRVVEGSNFGVGKGFYWLLGGCDESFRRWGMEDLEFGYRAYTLGGLLVPVRDAAGWHQSRWAQDRAAKDRSLAIQRGKAAQLIAHPHFRSNRPGRIYKVPQYVVTVIDGGDLPFEALVETVANILDDRACDLVVRLEIRSDENDERLERIHEEFASDPRVRVGVTGSALDDFPAAALHVALPVGVSGSNLVHRLHGKLGDAVAAVAPLGDGATVSIGRAWALHRARRSGGRVEDFGDVRSLSPRALGLASGEPAAARRARSGRAARWRLLRDWAREIRHPMDAWSLLKGLVVAVRWRMANRSRAAGRPLRRLRP